MSRQKRKAVASLAGLALTGGACLSLIAAAPAASAASSACGSSCIALYNQKFGSADVSAVSGGSAVPGQPVILAAAAPSTTEDWEISSQGHVSDFVAAGLMSATLGTHYGTDSVYEFQYAPGNISSGLCLGIASSPVTGTKVTLQPCGVSARTTWINDAADASGGYAPLISGSDTQYPAPYVLAAGKVGRGFVTRPLKMNKKGVAAKAQLWQLIAGVLP